MLLQRENNARIALECSTALRATAASTADISCNAHIIEDDILAIKCSGRGVDRAVFSIVVEGKIESCYVKKDQR